MSALIYHEAAFPPFSIHYYSTLVFPFCFLRREKSKAMHRLQGLWGKGAFLSSGASKRIPPGILETEYLSLSLSLSLWTTRICLVCGLEFHKKRKEEKEGRKKSDEGTRVGFIGGSRAH